MNITVELAPYELAIINGEIMRNGPDPQTITLEADARYLRESEILAEQDADTPSKLLYLALEHTYLARDNHVALKHHVLKIADEIAFAAPEFQGLITEIAEAIADDAFRDALNLSRDLIVTEKRLLEQAFGPHYLKSLLPQ
ncbi:MAG: hypothetical protein JJU40_16440 [Rhodobacteraceae bacterium]|nr:hypothetical protein [Paracoccaceae bacterium]